MWKGLMAALLLAAPWAVAAAQQVAEEEAQATDVEWPLPWKPGTRVEYDQSYRTVDVRGGKPWTITGSDRTVLEIVRADQDGFVQRWTGTDPKLDAGELPAPMAAILKATVEGMRDLAIDVRLDGQGAFAGISNMDELHPRYRAAMRAMLDGLSNEGNVPDAATKVALGKMLDTLTARPVFEQQLAEIPAAYNFVAGGGLELDAEYEYEDSGTNPLGGEPIPMRNRMRLGESDDPAFYTLRWEVEPDAEAIAAMVTKFVESMTASMAPKADADEKAEHAQALEAAKANAKFTTTVDYLIEKATGLVERMEHVQMKRFGTKDETTTTLLQRRR